MEGLLPAGIDPGSVYRALFEASPDAILLVDSSGQILLSNPVAASLLGYAVEELQGMAVDLLVPDAIRPRHAGFRHSYGQQPRTRPMGTQTGLVARRKDGSTVLVEIALSPLQVKGLQVVVAAVRDIGAYPRVKEALQRARYGEHLARLGRQAVDSRDPQALLDSVPLIAVEAMQVEMAVVLLLENDASSLRVASGHGTPPGEAIGNRLPLHVEASAAMVVADGLPLIVGDYRLETRFVVPQHLLDAGLRSALAVPVSDRGRTIGALLVRSTQAQRFGQEEQRFLAAVASLLATSLQRAKTEEALNHAQRLESVGQLTGGIAHDFNNLLTVIQGNLQVIEDLPSVAQDGTAQQLLAAATRATRRGAELTGKLLAFSRRQVLQPQAVNVADLLESLADMLRRTLDQRITIVVEHAAGCPPVLADPGQLESALLNIAINARDAMHEGGSLRFASAYVQALPADLVGGHADGGHADGDGASAEGGDSGCRTWVAISVSDNGSGMDEGVRKRAFEPFFTTKEAGRGTGLGLSTVYGFVKQSKGAVAVRSAPGAGTTVTLFIPQADHASSAAAPAPRADGGVPRGMRVLLVEDDGEVRQVVAAALLALGCVPTQAASGEQALALLEQGLGTDLLLSDIALGAGIRGTDLAQRVQTMLPTIAVVLMSGFSEELLDADRSAPPSWELLPKPFSREALARTLALAAEVALTGKT